MPEALTTIFKGVWDRLQHEALTYLPPLIAAAIVVFGASIVAVVLRRILYRIAKGAALHRFLRRSGVAHLIDPSGQLRKTNMVAEVAYWSVLTVGMLVGLSVFGTDLTSQLIQTFISLIPRLVIAGAIVLGGVWLGQYLSRCALVWAFDEGLPHPRRVAVAVRIIVQFVAIVVAADHLNFARSVFLTAFIILAGGLALSVSLAVGIGGSGRIREYLQQNNQQRERERENAGERSMWSHL
jgi:hypothetical protein